MKGRVGIQQKEKKKNSKKTHNHTNSSSNSNNNIKKNTPILLKKKLKNVKKAIPKEKKKKKKKKTQFVSEVGRCLLSSSMGPEVGVVATCNHFSKIEKKIRAVVGAGTDNAAGTVATVTSAEPATANNTTPRGEGLTSNAVGLSGKDKEKETIKARIREEVELFLSVADVALLRVKLYQQRQQNRKLLQRRTDRWTRKRGKTRGAMAVGGINSSSNGGTGGGGSSNNISSSGSSNSTSTSVAAAVATTVEASAGSGDAGERTTPHNNTSFDGDGDGDDGTASTILDNSNNNDNAKNSIKAKGIIVTSMDKRKKKKASTTSGGGGGGGGGERPILIPDFIVAAAATAVAKKQQKQQQQQEQAPTTTTTTSSLSSSSFSSPSTMASGGNSHSSKDVANKIRSGWFCDCQSNHTSTTHKPTHICTQAGRQECDSKPSKSKVCFRITRRQAGRRAGISPLLCTRIDGADCLGSNADVVCVLVDVYISTPHLFVHVLREYAYNKHTLARTHARMQRPVNGIEDRKQREEG